MAINQGEKSWIPPKNPNVNPLRNRKSDDLIRIQMYKCNPLGNRKSNKNSFFAKNSWCVSILNDVFGISMEWVDTWAVKPGKFD